MIGLHQSAAMLTPASDVKPRQVTFLHMLPREQGVRQPSSKGREPRIKGINIEANIPFPEKTLRKNPGMQVWDAVGGWAGSSRRESFFKYL